MDRILKILKKENGPRASSAPALELNTIIFKHVYWYMQQISGERLQDHWSSGFFKYSKCLFLIIVLNKRPLFVLFQSKIISCPSYKIKLIMLFFSFYHFYLK